MQQFPFAHTLEMTYRLAGRRAGSQDADRESQRRADAGGDRVSSVLPVDRFDARGLDALDRREDALAAGARTRFRPAKPSRPRSSFPIARRSPLKDFDLDHVFGDLERDAQGRAVMSVKGKTQQLDVAARTELQVDRPVFAEPGERARRWRRRRTRSGAAGATPAPRQRAGRAADRRRMKPSPIAASSPSSRWSASPTR